MLARQVPPGLAGALRRGMVAVMGALLPGA